MEVLTSNILSYLSTPKKPTDIKNVMEHSATKVVENGHLVIIMNGVRYNALGAQL